MELRVEDIFKLSQSITSEEEILKFGVKGLKLQYNKIQEALRKHGHHISYAAYDVLSMWFKQQPSRKEARVNLLAALEKCGMSLLAADIGLQTKDFEVTLKEACAKGWKVIYRGRLNLVGFLKAGKTSFLQRLLGKEFLKELERTEGIAIQLVMVKAEDWKEAVLDVDQLRSKHHQAVAEAIKTQTFQTTDRQQTAVSPLPEQRRRHQAKQENDEAPHQIDRTSQKKISEMVQNPEIKDEEKEDCVLFTWDFGGQAAYYATHQLFLGIEATHLILMDVTKPFTIPIEADKETNSIACIPSTPAEFLCYWLHSIHNEAVKAETWPNVAVILTHTDLVEESDVRKYKEEILRHLKQKRCGAYISERNIFDVDNTTSDDETFRVKRREILQKITKQSTWGQRRPVKWLQLEADIRNKAKVDDVPYMKISEIHTLASKCGMKEEEVNSFLKFHHSMGELLHFTENELSDLVIVNTAWLVNQFKVIIAPHEFLEKKKELKKITEKLKKGKVSEDDLRKIWGDRHQFLMDLMQKFDLLIPLKHPQETSAETPKEYLVSSILPAPNKDEFEEKLLKRQLIKIYHATHTASEPLPIGTFNTLVSKCSKRENWELYLNARKFFSSTGVCFESDKGLHVVILLLSHLECPRFETSFWCRRREIDECVSQAVGKDIRTTRQALKEELMAVDVTPAAEFQLLCPNWNSGCNDKCYVTLEEDTDRKTKEPIYHSGETKCVTKEIPWKTSTYNETCFAQAFGGAADDALEPTTSSRPDGVKEERELTDAHLLKLSKKITEKHALYTLAVLGLGMFEESVAAHLKNEEREISMAAYNVLKQWRTSQENKNVAYIGMKEALSKEGVGMSSYIDEVL